MPNGGQPELNRSGARLSILRPVKAGTNVQALSIGSIPIRSAGRYQERWLSPWQGYTPLFNAIFHQLARPTYNPSGPWQWVILFSKPHCQLIDRGLYTCGTKTMGYLLLKEETPIVNY